MQAFHSLFKTVLRTISVLTLAFAVLIVSAPVQAQAPAEEQAGLQFMIEEEKLARDVYLTLDTQWNLRIFQNISQAEQQHMDAVANLLTQYGLDNPIEGNDVGAFTDTELQSLYNQLIDDGSQSLTAALLVGTAIEEIDILDLEEAMRQTSNPDILRVYTNLMQGSENHLRAFVSNWERQTGETYAPQYMSQTDYDEIVSAASGRGDRGNGRRGNGK